MALHPAAGPAADAKSETIGVVVGVPVAMTLCACRVHQLTEISRELVEDALGATPVDPRYGRAVLRLQQRLLHQFEYAEDPDRVVIDLRDPHVWDASTVAALDASTPNDQRKGKPVKIARINKASAERHGRLTGELPSH